MHLKLYFGKIVFTQNEVAKWNECNTAGFKLCLCIEIST